MEDLSRDGLRAANLTTFVLAHLLTALTDDAHVMPVEERVQTVETLRELQHVSTRHFAQITAQSLVTRRACAAQALNFPDRRVLTGAPVSSSLFGDGWEAPLKSELKRRQEPPAFKKPSRKRKRQGVSRPSSASVAPAAPSWIASRSGEGGRGRGRGQAPAALGAPPPSQPVSLGQLREFGFNVAGLPQRGARRGVSRDQRGSFRGHGSAPGFRGRGRGPRRGARGPPTGGPQA